MARSDNRRILSFAVDEELYLRIEAARDANGAMVGAPISKSMFYRQLISSALSNPRPPVETGAIEGYIAAYVDSMRIVRDQTFEMKRQLEAAIEQVRAGDMEIGVTSDQGHRGHGARSG